MNIDEAIEHANQVADSYEDTAPACKCAHEHRQLADWLTELKILRTENAKLKEELEAVGTAAYLYGCSDLKIENVKLRELCVLNWEWAHSCCGNSCKMQTDGCGYGIDRECNYEREIYYRMRELGVDA